MRYLLVFDSSTILGPPWLANLAALRPCPRLLLSVVSLKREVDIFFTTKYRPTCFPASVRTALNKIGTENCSLITAGDKEWERRVAFLIRVLCLLRLLGSGFYRPSDTFIVF